MAENYVVSEGYINSLIENYMNKLFYFCLKKTGSRFEAENLMSDILLNIITSLNKGTLPENFKAYVWKIARNRYSVWAAKKHNHNEWIAGSDINDYEINDSNADTENKVMQGETMSLLRRELAFISSEYRNIIVAYYIEDRKIKDIAVSLNLPEGTVKSNLFRARKVLKEGMNMAREFGIRSYKPENVNFAASGSQPSGLPWKAVQRKLPKNILLEADNNPLTIEELAIELGIAMPYMEEEVNLLVEATLLKKIGDKYITNIFIVSNECQMEIYKAQREESEERSRLLGKIVDDSLDKIRKLGIVKNNMSDADLRWWITIFGVDSFIQSMNSYNIYYPEKRANGETWGFMGFEVHGIEEDLMMGHNGHGGGKTWFWTYKINDSNLCHRAGEMDYTQTMFLADVLKNGRKLSSFSESELAIWKTINNRFAHSDDEGNIISDILVLEDDAKEKCKEILFSHPLASQLTKKFTVAFDKTTEILKRNSSPVLENQLCYCASMMILNTRMMTVHDEMKAGKLVAPQNPDKSTIAMWIEFE